MARNPYPTYANFGRTILKSFSISVETGFPQTLSARRISRMLSPRVKRPMKTMTTQTTPCDAPSMSKEAPTTGMLTQRIAKFLVERLLASI